MNSKYTQIPGVSSNGRFVLTNKNKQVIDLCGLGRSHSHHRAGQGLLLGELTGHLTGHLSHLHLPSYHNTIFPITRYITNTQKFIKIKRFINIVDLSILDTGGGYTQSWL